MLTPREEKVLELRNQGLTIEQVGKELGITRERVRQIESKANYRLEYAKKRELSEVRNDCVKAIKWLRENRNNYEEKSYMVDACLDTIEREVRKLDIVISVLNGEYDFDIEQEINKEQHPILDKPISELNLSVRAYNCLMRYFTFGCCSYGKDTIKNLKVRDLCNLTEEDLMKVKNLGLKSLKEIKDKLESLGLKLKEDQYAED